MIVFANPKFLSLLQRSNTCDAEGTFKVVPEYFFQLYTIYAEVDGYVCMLSYMIKMNLLIVNFLENFMKSQCKTADHFHQDFNTTPSSVPDFINTTVSFDSSWKTRGFYSNLGFGSVISALTKKSLIMSYSIASVRSATDAKLSGEENILTNT